MLHDITFGGDPEFFVVDKKGNGVGAWEFFPGTKDDPFELMDGSVQVDGFAVEIGINPTSDVEELLLRTDRLVEQCREFIPNDHEFLFNPHLKYSESYFNKAPAGQKVIGCDPSWDYIYHTELEAPPLVNSSTRYAGGHIHVGFGEFNIEEYYTKIVLDNVARNVTFNSHRVWDYHPKFGSSLQRLTNYCCHYSIRHKPYGIEFRRPCNHWANPSSSKRDRVAVFDRITKVLSQYRNVK
jgi:hypothetical protein